MMDLRRVPSSLALRFVRGSGWDSRVIEYTTRAWTSHVELSYHGFTFGAQLRGGVRWRPRASACYRNVTRTETWSVETNERQDDRLWEVIRETNFLPYDWRAILSFGMGERDWREPDSWFCSEWAAMVLEQLGIVKFPTKLPFDRITPRDVYLIFTRITGVEKTHEFSS